MKKPGETRKFDKLMRKAGFSKNTETQNSSHVKYVHETGYIETCTENVKHASRLFNIVSKRLKRHLDEKGS